MKAKSSLIICNLAPWSGSFAREVLDLALAGAAFDLPIGLFFLDDAVWQLVSNQQSKAIEQKDLCANLKALPLFGIESLYVSKDSLKQRNIQETDLIFPVELVGDCQLVQLFNRYDVVINL